MSEERIARIKGCSERTVQRELRRLEEVDLIEIQKRPDYTSLYFIKDVEPEGSFLDFKGWEKIKKRVKK